MTMMAESDSDTQLLTSIESSYFLFLLCDNQSKNMIMTFLKKTDFPNRAREVSAHSSCHEHQHRR